MWVDVLIENWQATVFGAIGSYMIGRDIWNSLPMNSLKKIFSKESGNIIGSANVVYGEVNNLISETKKNTKLLIEEIKELKSENITKDKQVEVISSAFVSLLSSVQVPLNAKQNMYQAIKDIDVLTQSSLKALEVNIKNEETQLNQVIEEDNELDEIIQNNV
jgi:hypothetical protein